MRLIHLSHLGQHLVLVYMLLLSDPASLGMNLVDASCHLIVSPLLKSTDLQSEGILSSCERPQDAVYISPRISEQ